VGPSPRPVRAAATAALEHPAVRAELSDAGSRLLSAVPVASQSDHGDGPDHVRATVYGYMNERALIAEAPIGDHLIVPSTHVAAVEQHRAGDQHDHRVAAEDARVLQLGERDRDLLG
jgi:hypothetical protein